MAPALDPAHTREMWSRKLYLARGAAAGLLLLASGLGCGGKADAGQPTQDPAPTETRNVPRSAPPSASAGEPPRPAAGGTTGEAPSPQTMPAVGDDDSLTAYTVDVSSVDRVLRTNCGPCHSSTAPVTGSGGIRFIDDVDQLVVAGLIVPLDSAASRVVVVSANGSMPPPSSGLPVMSDVDLQVLVSFIDNPLFWPEPYSPVAVDAGPAPLVDAGADGG